MAKVTFMYFHALYRKEFKMKICWLIMIKYYANKLYGLG